MVNKPFEFVQETLKGEDRVDGMRDKDSSGRAPLGRCQWIPVAADLSHREHTLAPRSMRSPASVGRSRAPSPS